MIAQQGGWETYRMNFLFDLAKAVDLFCKRKKVHRAVSYELKSAHLSSGLQLADFYAGTVRKMLLGSMTGLTADCCTPYDQVQHHSYDKCDRFCGSIALIL